MVPHIIYLLIIASFFLFGCSGQSSPSQASPNQPSPNQPSPNQPSPNQPSPAAQDTLPAYLEQESVPATKYHLTARPWQAFGSEHYLDVVEGLARYWSQQEDPQIPGRILDPFGGDLVGPPGLSPQISIGTLPYSVAILYKNGRAMDLLALAIRVMDYETKWYADRVALNDFPGAFLFPLAQLARVSSRQLDLRHPRIQACFLAKQSRCSYEPACPNYGRGRLGKQFLRSHGW